MKLIRDGKEVKPELIRPAYCTTGTPATSFTSTKSCRCRAAVLRRSDHVEKRAMELDAKAGMDVSKLKALHVSATEWDETYPHPGDPRLERLERLPLLPVKRS